MMKIVANLILLLFYVVLQISFVPSIGQGLNNLNLALCVIIFVTVIISYDAGLWLSFGSGLLLELYSIYPFGVVTLSFLIITMVVNILFKNLFTNRSLYSLLALGVLGTFIYGLIMLVSKSLIFIADPTINIAVLFGPASFYELFWQIIFNSTLLALTFLTMNFISHRLKAYFIISGNYE